MKVDAMPLSDAHRRLFFGKGDDDDETFLMPSIFPGGPMNH